MYHTPYQRLCISILIIAMGIESKNIYPYHSIDYAVGIKATQLIKDYVQKQENLIASIHDPLIREHSKKLLTQLLKVPWIEVYLYYVSNSPSTRQPSFLPHNPKDFFEEIGYTANEIIHKKALNQLQYIRRHRKNKRIIPLLHVLQQIDWFDAFLSYLNAHQLFRETLLVELRNTSSVNRYNTMLDRIIREEDRALQDQRTQTQREHNLPTNPIQIILYELSHMSK